MRKKLWFRTLTILLAATTLLSSTSAYNLLVYANQEIDSSALSATVTDESYEPNITVQGGDLIVDTNAESAPETFTWGTDANGNAADGSQQNPYQISSLEHLLKVNEIVNDSTGTNVSNPENKYFVLTADIDISSVKVSDFIESTGSAYLISTDHKNPDSNWVYINIDGSYVDSYGQTQRHKITGGTSGWDIEIPGHQNFSLFGYLSEKSVVSNIIFENLKINVTTASPRQVALVANKNDGVIENCTINNCSVTTKLNSNHNNPYYIMDGKNFYNGVAAVVADNAGTVRGVTVNDIAITVKGEDDYIGAVVAQNRGLVTDSAVSGIQINATVNNYYIGGIAGYNEPDSASLGVQNCAVNTGGTKHTVNNFTRGAYVGGLVGSNDGYLYNSSVTGTFKPADTTTVVSYNMLGSVNYSSDETTYYGGAAGISTGVISNVTVSDLGFFFSANTSMRRAYFGGITSTVTSAGSIVNCVSTGSFTAAEGTDIYSGGVIAYAPANIADGAIKNTYTLFSLNNPTKTYMGAVIGWGGKASTLSGCYWSDQVSGCATSYVQTDSYYTDLVAGADALTGNLYSSNKAVIAGRNLSVSVPKTEIVNKWEGTGVIFTTPDSDVTVPTNVANNTLAKAPYSVDVTFPDSVGSADKKTMSVGFNIDVLVTTATGDPDDINDPMVISTAAQTKFLYLVPYGHFKLGQRVSVEADSWKAPIFSGTLDGDGKTITVGGPLFDAVIGNRAGDIGSALNASTYSTDPNSDNQTYLKQGYVKNLTVDLYDNITTSVFGNLINATFVNVNLTDGDVSSDDGDADTFDGFVATLSDKRNASFVAAANGYTYIYGCSSNVSTYIEDDSQGNSYNDLAILIGKLSGNVTVDNCYINANIYIKGGISSNTGRAAFLGNISENKGYILNSAICTNVVYIATGVSGSHCAVVFGKMDNNNNYGKYKNIVWSKNKPNQVLYPSASTFDNTQIHLWGGTATSGGNYSYPEKTVAPGVQTSFTVAIPQNIKAFADVTANDFSVSADNGETSSFTIQSVELDGTNIKFVVKAKDDAVINSKDFIRVFHQSSGLTTFVRLVVKEAGLVYNAEDGYYHIASATDIKFISENNDKSDPNVSGRTYGQAAYYLDADIDMTGIQIAPIGNSARPFTGVFTGPIGADGKPLYTISNLNIETTADNAGLFGAVDFSGADMVIGANSDTVRRGISNIAISAATVKGKSNVAVLVGYAADPDIGLSASQRDDVYGDVYIKNIIISDSKVYSGTNTDAASGKSAAAVLAYAECVNLDITDIRVSGVEVMTYHSPTNPVYFVAKYENGGGYSAGIGSVLGAIHESYRGYNVSEAMNVNINNVDVSGVTLSGVNVTGKTYAPANAGGVVGCFLTQYTTSTIHYATLNIGNAKVSDTVIKTSGNGGGVLGASNVITNINGAHVYGSKKAAGAEDIEALPMRILAETDYFVGGIAGYIGAKIRDDNGASDGASLTKVYGSVTNSKVENADVRAIINENDIANQRDRNVTVGGIVGAINGKTDSNAVSGCTVIGSHIEGIVVGGIVGSGVETTGTAGGNLVPDPTVGNSINIDGCSVLGSEITTINGCIPVAEEYYLWMAYGVGGILGTNRRNLWSYAMYTTIQRCHVDKNTTITNTIAAPAHAATGGILGSGYENGIDAGALVIKYNEVYAKIVSENNVPANTTVPDATGDFYVTLSATGGLVGALIGTQYDVYEPENYEVCDLSKISIQHSVFGGSIIGTDGIGGAIGVISAASAYNTTAIPTNLLSDIAITGSLASTLVDNANIRRGGIAIGHIPVKSNGTAASDEDDHYAFDVTSGTDITGAFNKIYFTSFEIDTTKWPVFGYHNATASTISADYSPLATTAKAMFINCYEDINTEDDNSTPQFAFAESANTYILPATQYPAETRPAGVAGAYSVAGQVWKGSNADIAKITSTGPNDLTVEPLNSGTMKVSINYIGTVGDSVWSTQVAIPAGFEFKSNNQAPLDYVEVDGKTYYLVTNPYDLGIVGKNMTDGAANQGSFDAEHLALNYWIAKDIDIPASMFVTDGFFDGGFIPIGTSALPFTGTFESMPAGNYTSAGGIEFVSDGNMTIKGLQFADGVHMGLFDTAQGATFRNFTLENVTATCTKASTGTSNIAYIGAVAATAKDYVTAEGITLKGLNLTGANHTAGLFGGIIASSTTGTSESVIKNCAVVGDTSDDVYSNVIVGRYGVAGIVSHTTHNSTNMSGITVADAAITQEYTGADNGFFDYGAAGISLAFSGVIKAEGENRNKIIGCSITGEVASGVVTRSYTSKSKTAFSFYDGRTVAATNTPAARAAIVSINNVDVIGTKVTGTHTANAMSSAHNYSASGGILARVDVCAVDHIINDCTLDSGTHIKALYGAGGIVGCFESTSSSATNVAYRLAVKSCETYATVEVTQMADVLPTNTTFSNRMCVGAGAILGYIPRWILSYYTTIKDCTAGGIVRGAGNIGGIVGANWSQNTNTSYAVDDRPDHFAENCVVSAKFETSEGVSAFATDTKWVGVIVGHPATSYNISTNSACLLDGNFKASNYPFYNIYISDSVYRDEYVRLYGITNSANNYSLNTYDYYTDYVYNLNRTGTYTIQNNAAGTPNSSVGGVSYLTYTEDTYRVSVKGNFDSEKYIYKLNYSYIQGGGHVFNTSDFALDTSVIGSDQFYFNPGASIDGFTVTADTSKGAVTAAGSESTEFVLESITCADRRVTITPTGSAPGQYKLTTTPLTGGVNSQLYFNYTNGLTLTVGIEIEIKPEDYWVRANADDSSVNDLLIFNAANLSYVRSMAGVKSVITQCYDVYWTVSDSELIAAANAAIAGKTLGDVYSDAFLDDLATYMHPNPAYDGTAATERYITFDQMYSTSDTASRRAVLLSELVGNIGNTSFEAYGEDCGSTIYSRNEAFAGKYQVLSAEKAASGLTQLSETYKIYGLDLRADTMALVNNTHAGMFNKIGSGAVIKGVSFVNPEITAVKQGADENYVGVLAGEIDGATLENISIYATDGNRASVVSMRTVNCVGTNVGAVAGKVSNSTLNNINISGVDVVGAATAGTTPSDTVIRNVFVGGVAGSFSGTLTGVNVADANILVNRNEGVHKNYIAYAGGIVGATTGNSKIADAEITALISGCDAEVVLEEGLLKTSYEANAFSEAGDRLGGVVGLAKDNLEVTGAKLTSVVINAYDVAGGIIAEVANNAGNIYVTGCDIGKDTTQIIATINGATSTSGAANKRPFYNAVGGVVGYVDNVTSLKITDCDVFGKIGQQSLEHKNCTAGGIIGLVGENLASLNSIVITTSTVQGEVSGYRRKADSNATGSALRILGASGGIIGKIYNFATKTFDSSDTMISKSIVSAKIELYTSVNGTTVKADFATLENQSDTNVGKIIGEVRNDGTQMNFAKAAGSALDNNVEFTDYVENVYLSSYPQNIVAYGCNSFYINQFNDASDTYIDINYQNRYMSAEAESAENVSSFMVDSTIADPTTPPTGENPYNSRTYSDVAIITFNDDNPQTGTSSSRFFRLAYDKIDIDGEGSLNKLISFEQKFNISVEDDSVDLNKVTVSANHYNGETPGLTETVEGTTHSYSYYPGVITVETTENMDIVGYISAKYSYGLEVGIQFVSMEIAGNGSADKPFQVEKPKHFKVVRALRGAYYNQVANIDFAAADANQYSPATEGALFADGKGIDPIGTSSAPFTGVYNGQGYVLSNVYIARSDEDNVGFFGYIGTGNTAATLKNVHIELASELNITDENSNVTTVVGGITGKDKVGGLVGYANNAVITNCSVADGFVIGRTAVGGLVGRANNSQLNSCFTSTSTYSYDTVTTDAKDKNVGALIGLVSSTTSIINSFTLGLASVGTTNTNGVAGGFVGYVSSGTLNIADSLVAATVSEYNGAVNNRGLTVGQSAGVANVIADGVIVAPTNALVISDKSVVNPILSRGATVTDVFVDTDLVGSPNGSEEYTKVTKVEGCYNFSVSSEADVAGDAYTSAYVDLAVLPIEVDPNEVDDKLNNVNKYAGYMYPLTVNHGAEYTFSSSILDLSDTVEYPAGLDSDMYGIKTPEGINKNTDILFRDKDGSTKVYPNVYSTQTGEVLSNGTIHSNGEVAYSTKMPYFDMTKSITVGNLNVDVTRKVYYPVVGSKTDGVDKFYAVATARQLFALSNSREVVEGSKFYDFCTLNGEVTSYARDYILVADIDMSGDNFVPVSGFEGTFDGNGYTADNLTINMPSYNEIGMFRSLSNAEIRNLTVGVNEVVGKDNVGALVGAIVTQNVSNKSDSATVRIENCHVVQSEGGNGVIATGSNVGGLVGAATRSKYGFGINDSSASVTVSGYNVVGGLVGYSEQPVTNSYSTGAVNVEFRPSSDVVQVHPWIINGTQAIAGAPLASSGEYGAGGVVGVLYNDSKANGAEQAAITYCFGSGIVTVSEASYNSAESVYGVGGLAGITYSGAEVSTSFSSGNVYYCYGNSTFDSCANNTVGVGGLVGVNYNDLKDVYSGASVAADFGDVTTAAAVGAGGVIGVAYGKLSDAYSSGATLGTTTTVDYSNSNYGAGGVIGLLDSGVQSANLLFDLNISITDKVVGKIISGSIDSNSKALSTAYLTAGNKNLINYQFGYIKGAYPYLNAFFKNNVSLVIRINALLSVVALQLNPLDTLAANGEGISMALNIPVDFKYVSSGSGDDTENVGIYKYSYADENDIVDAAQGVIDIGGTNTLSIQRTQNEAQYVNFVISIDSKDGNKTDKDGNVYSQVANRLVSRLCAPMLGTESHPYLVATQEDLKHVGMTSAELDALNASAPNSMYRQWATPILENGTPVSGAVNFKLMGYVTLDGYNRTISDLTNQIYNVEGQSIAYDGIYFDGNGYSIRNLTGKLFAKLDSKSTLRNMTFENVNFAGTSLIGELNGTVEGVNVYGKASGISYAAIANTVGSNGKIIGAVANVDYTDSTSTNDVAGIAITNNGEITMSASVGNFTGGAVSGMGGLVVNNNGTISNSFTIGNIVFDDATNLGGFVNNNTGSIQNCYTRCNITVSNTDSDRVIGGFAAHNSNTIKSAYSSGMFELKTDTNPYSIFVAESTGTLKDCMFDKQLSGSKFSGIYNLAERTLDIVYLTNHQSMQSTDTRIAYDVSDDIVVDEANEIYHNVYYPQLKAILNTKVYETQKDDNGNDVQVETVDSRMYRVLRAYSFISSATALVGNDNYIDNLALKSSTPLSYDSVNIDLWERTSGSELASETIIGDSGNVKGRKILAVDTLPDGYNSNADNRSVFSATVTVEDFYGLIIPLRDENGEIVKDAEGKEVPDYAQLDLFAEVTGLGHPNFAGGQGTAGDPFEISTPDQFVALSFYGTNPVNNFMLINDIDMSQAVWSSYIDNFKANLNGNGKVVSNVTIGADGNDSLFGKINGGKIDGLGVAGIDVTVDGSSGGMLASSATGKASITNSYVVGTLTTTDTAQSNVGGIVGEIDDAVIEGCIVSGKINSDASATGGVVASALDRSVIRNVLSTVYIDAEKAGTEGVAAGIVASAHDGITLENCVFASDVKAAISGNITGDGAAHDTCYYDMQMSSVSDSATAKSTHYLTNGATMEQLKFGTSMTRLNGFSGYPVPVAFANQNTDNGFVPTEQFLAGVKLASARINLASGAGAGSISTFTTITAPSTLGTFNAQLTFGSYESVDNYYLVKPVGTTTQIDTYTAALPLGLKADRYAEYKLSNGSFDGGKMLRYLDLDVGKALKVTYKYEGLDADANAVLSVFSGMSNISGVTAFAVKNKHSGNLCSSMVVPMDSDEGAYILRVGSELPAGKSITSVSAEVSNNGSKVLDATPTEMANGTWKLAMTSDENIDCDEIVIIINVEDAPIWGVRKLFNLF